MDKHKLKQLIDEGLSSNAIGELVGKSPTTIRYWVNKHELNTKRVYKCRICKNTDSSNFTAGRYSECKKCRRKDQNKTTQKRKRQLVEYKGGKCEICGYNKCIAALDFHHKNPDEKDPNWKRIRRWTLERSKYEIDKCELVCRNCHSEIHYG